MIKSIILLTNSIHRSVKISFPQKYVGIILLLGTLIIGLSTYKNYGISRDEKDMRTTGMLSYNYVFHKLDYSYLKNSESRYHGVGFELPMLVVESALKLKDSRDIFLMRHLVTHLFFLLGAFAFFLLIDFLFRNKLLASLGFLILLTTPLIYGQSFFNCKDVPFLSMLMICLLVIAVAFKKNNYKWYILLGIACGFLTSIRIMGVILIGWAWIFFAIDWIASTRDKNLQKPKLGHFIVFNCVTVLVLYVTWPYLYRQPIHNFIATFKSFSSFAASRGNVLFGGTEYWGTKIPPYYAISWFCISNPVVYLLMGFFGIFYFIVRLIKNSRQFIFDKVLRNQLLYLFCFLQPLLAIILYHSIVYNAWRHIYFIYPPFILLGLYGLDYLLKTKTRVAVLFFVIAGICSSGFYMIKNFPYEYVYFNRLAGSNDPENLRKRWELDYWGASYKQAFEYILKNDHSAKITITVANLPGKDNLLILKPEDRKRINLADDSTINPNYFITNYRYHAQDYPYLPSQDYHSIKVMNSSIITIFKTKFWSQPETVISATTPKEQLSVQEPNVLYDTCPQLLKNSKWVFKMWYRSGWSNPYVSYAESTDGINWTKYDSVLIEGHYCPSIVKHNGTYYIHAVTVNWNKLDLYTSTDGLHFTFNSTSVKADRKWGAFGNSAAFVDTDGVWKMLYDAAVVPVHKWCICLATSKDGINWVGNFVLSRKGTVSACDVHKIDGTYWAWLQVSPTECLPTDIYRYKSKDLMNWVETSPGASFNRGTTDEGVNTDVGQVADPSLVEVNGKTYMFYDACSNGYYPTGNPHIKLVKADMPISDLVKIVEGPRFAAFH